MAKLYELSNWQLNIEWHTHIDKLITYGPFQVLQLNLNQAVKGPATVLYCLTNPLMLVLLLCCLEGRESLNLPPCEDSAVICLSKDICCRSEMGIVCLCMVLGVLGVVGPGVGDPSPAWLRLRLGVTAALLLFSAEIVTHITPRWQCWQTWVSSRWHYYNRDAYKYLHPRRWPQRQQFCA